ncbi:hypothetical protein [Lysinibacillus sp. NPDC092081]|uniref:hypothetical protein n=1 Tax=Lysinibacillus sp. NPDC092081 TaxID=3364131 RepID=UPI0037FFD949
MSALARLFYINGTISRFIGTILYFIGKILIFIGMIFVSIGTIFSHDKTICCCRYAFAQKPSVVFISRLTSLTATYFEEFQHIIPYEKMDNEYRHNLFDWSIIYASCGI